MRENLTSGSRWQGMETRLAMPRRHSLTLPPDKWESARLTSLFLTSGLYCPQAESAPAHLRVTQTVTLKTSKRNQLIQKEVTSVRYIYIILIVVAMAIVLLFVFQNTLSTTVSFFSASVTLPLSILVLVTYIMGILTGGIVVSFLRVLIRGTGKKQNHA
jgi:putative membrane protein